MFKINSVLLNWRLLYNDFECHSLLGFFSVNIHFKALGMNKIGTPRPFLVLTRCHIVSWEGKFVQKKPSKKLHSIQFKAPLVCQSNTYFWSLVVAKSDFICGRFSYLDASASETQFPIALKPYFIHAQSLKMDVKEQAVALKQSEIEFSKRKHQARKICHKYNLTSLPPNFKNLYCFDKLKVL